MTGLCRYKYIFLICALSLISSCSPDPSMEMLESYKFQFENGSVEKMLPGETTIVTLKAKNNLNRSDNRANIIFDIIWGGGSVSEQSVCTDNAGYVTITWQLGNESCEQLLRASCYSLSGKYLASIDLAAYSFMENQWNAISEKPDGYISDMVSDTINKLTYAISTNKLYRQGSRYFLWDEVFDTNLVSPRTIEMDGNGIIYVSTWNGEIVKSTDHGFTWKKCNKPYPDNPYYIYMDVANDNYIWAGKFDFPVKFSKDGGISWQNAGGNLSPFLNDNTFRLKSGALVNHGTNGTSRERFNISYDDGLTWISRETPGYSTVMYVNENDEIFVGTQKNGFTFYQTTDLGATFKEVYNVFPQWGTTMENNIFTRWNGFYYIIVPGYGILKSADLIHYENYWRNSDLNDLFIDHNGVLIAKDWDYKTVYYLKSSD